MYAFKTNEGFVKSSNKNDTKKFGFKEIKNVMFNIKYVNVYIIADRTPFNPLLSKREPTFSTEEEHI